MLHRPALNFSGLVIPPLMLGIGIGIGAVGSASASNITSAVTNAMKTAANSVQCATTQMACISVTNTAKDGVAILGASQAGLGIEGTSMSSVGVTGASQYSNGLNGKSVGGFGVNGASTLSNGVVGTSVNGTKTSVGVLGTNTGLGIGVEALGGTGPSLVVASNGSNIVEASGGAGPAPVAAAKNTNRTPSSSGYPTTATTAIIDGTGTVGDAVDILTGNEDNLGKFSGGPALVAIDSQQLVSTIIGTGEAAVNATNLRKAFLPYVGVGNGIVGTAAYGSGVIGTTNAAAGADSAGGVPAAVSANAPNGADIFLGYGGKGTFEVTNDGSINATGTITSGVSCAPTTCGTGVKLASYASRNASPTMEDFGRAELVNGNAVVRFDPTFAGTIDASRDYLVFLTPEGDSRGLYVTRRTALGFAVSESGGGHATLAFSYRIVAAPFASVAPRLAVIRTQPLAAAAFARERAALNQVKQKTTATRSVIEGLNLRKKPVVK